MNSAPAQPAFIANMLAHARKMATGLIDFVAALHRRAELRRKFAHADGIILEREKIRARIEVCDGPICNRF